MGWPTRRAALSATRSRHEPAQHAQAVRLRPRPNRGSTCPLTVFFSTSLQLRGIAGNPTLRLTPGQSSTAARSHRSELSSGNRRGPNQMPVRSLVASSPPTSENLSASQPDSSISIRRPSIRTPPRARTSHLPVRCWCGDRTDAVVRQPAYRRDLVVQPRKLGGRRRARARRVRDHPRRDDDVPGRGDHGAAR